MIVTIQPGKLLKPADISRLGADPCNGCQLREWCSDECGAIIPLDKEDSAPFIWPSIN